MSSAGSRVDDTLTDWRRLLEQTSQEVQEAVSGLGTRDRTRYVGRGASGDMTLLADKKAEDIILDALERVEDVSVLSEEKGESGGKASRYLAVLDPVDGSSNFSRGIPFYCTSIGILEGRSLRGARYGLVRDLVHGDVYYAERGKGAWKNGDRIAVSSVSDLASAVVGIDVSRTVPGAMLRLDHLLASSQRQAHLGANALELCMVADGRIDAFVDLRGKMRVTDLAAAYLIAVEAGAVITDDTGAELDPPMELDARFSYVAAGRALHSKILRILQLR